MAIFILRGHHYTAFINSIRPPVKDAGGVVEEDRVGSEAIRGVCSSACSPRNMNERMNVVKLSEL
jgi:hypothetical protein